MHVGARLRGGMWRAGGAGWRQHDSSSSGRRSEPTRREAVARPEADPEFWDRNHRSWEKVEELAGCGVFKAMGPMAAGHPEEGHRAHLVVTDRLCNVVCQERVMQRARAGQPDGQLSRWGPPSIFCHAGEGPLAAALRALMEAQGGLPEELQIHDVEDIGALPPIRIKPAVWEHIFVARRLVDDLRVMPKLFDPFFARKGRRPLAFNTIRVLTRRDLEAGPPYSGLEVYEATQAVCKQVWKWVEAQDRIPPALPPVG